MANYGAFPYTLNFISTVALLPAALQVHTEPFHNGLVETMNEVLKVINRLEKFLVPT